VKHSFITILLFILFTLSFYSKNNFFNDDTELKKENLVFNSEKELNQPKNMLTYPHAKNEKNCRHY
jgi:hypothetical protein